MERSVFRMIDRIEDRLFGNDATVSPGGWSCNSCAADAGGDEPRRAPLWLDDEPPVRRAPLWLD